jgi:hypothetical protein
MPARYALVEPGLVLRAEPRLWPTAPAAATTARPLRQGVPALHGLVQRLERLHPQLQS